MNNPAFIVDGYTELKIIQKLCPGRPIKRTDCNGRDVSISVIAKKIASHIRLLSNKYYPIIILVDKEDRKIDHEEMVEQLKEELEREGVANQDLRIGIADRMIENWILGDWETLNGSNNDKPSHTDGCNGSSTIKKIKKSYDKTTDGVDYFVSARQSYIYSNSPSYKHFIDQLEDILCSYMEFNR